MIRDEERLKHEGGTCPLLRLQLRYFSDRVWANSRWPSADVSQEIANLHYFPSSFVFPDEVTVKQRRRLLGNSLNVLVVARLLEVLLAGVSL